MIRPADRARTLVAWLKSPGRLLLASSGLSALMLGWVVGWMLFSSPPASLVVAADQNPVAGQKGTETTVVAGAPAQGLQTGTIVRNPVTPDAPAEAIAYIAIIIDDIGNNGPLGERAVALPGEVTYAVLPHTPFAVSLATQAHEQGKEVMLHAPMSNIAQRPLGAGGLTPALSKEEFMHSLQRSLASVPYVVGVNNHMGSELTGEKKQMQWLMHELKQRDLYFVDSLTTAASVAAQIATEYSVPNLRRQVFLDNDATFENIDAEFRRLLAIARLQGSAVGIGHPYEATIDYLEQALPLLEAEGIRLLPVSDMLQLHALSGSEAGITMEVEAGTENSSPETMPD